MPPVPSFAWGTPPAVRAISLLKLSVNAKSENYKYALESLKQFLVSSKVYPDAFVQAVFDIVMVEVHALMADDILRQPGLREKLHR